MRLDDRALPELARTLPVPPYDRSAVRAGIVHIGVGGFHRAHQAEYVDRLLASGVTDWGICGVGLLPGDRRMQEVLDGQDRLYTLVEKAADGTVEARVVGSLVEYLFAPDDPGAVVERMTDPAIRIVSLTVTEGGYNISPATGEFDADNPDVLADLQQPDAPRTVFALVTEALVRRRDRGVEPFTVLSCDNRAGNGELARTAFCAFADLRDPALGEWMRRTVRFPNSMVDRITPATTDDDRALVRDRFGIEDGWPVVCEPFEQWVIEDAFTGDRPPFEQVGAQVVDDVGPYEAMKLRLLNASHQALGYLGVLAGHTHVDDAARDPLFAEFVGGYMEHEATPTLPPVPGIDLADYRRTLLERFGNPGVRDTLARICTDSSERIPTFLLPVVRDQLAGDGHLRRAALVVAGWARYCEGTDESGRPIELVDPRREQLAAAAQGSGDDDLAFLRQRDLFGDLAENLAFTDVYREALASLHEHGTSETLRRWNDSDRWNDSAR